MSDTATMLTDADPMKVIEALEPAARRSDALLLDQMFRRVTGFQPRMFGPTMVAYGTYEYTYRSGHSGLSLAAGFAPRKAGPVIYNMGCLAERPDLAARLGRHSMGKGCLYIKRVSDIDLQVLADIVAVSLAGLRDQWPVRPT
jgi:hypothetical protein